MTFLPAKAYLSSLVTPNNCNSQVMLYPAN